MEETISQKYIRVNIDAWCDCRNENLGAYIFRLRELNYYLCMPRGLYPNYKGRCIWKISKSYPRVAMQVVLEYPSRLSSCSSLVYCRLCLQYEKKKNMIRSFDQKCTRAIDVRVTNEIAIPEVLHFLLRMNRCGKLPIRHSSVMTNTVHTSIHAMPIVIIGRQYIKAQWRFSWEHTKKIAPSC